MSNRIAYLMNEQCAEACKQEVYCKEKTPERDLILDLCERVDILNERINKWNRLSFIERIFKDI